MYLGLMLATFLMLVAVAFRRPWQYGLAAPEGKQWWISLPYPAGKAQTEHTGGVLVLVESLRTFFKDIR